MRILAIILFSLLFIEKGNAQSSGTNTLIDDLKYLSSDKLQGRKSGTEGNVMARQYIIQRFNEIGLAKFGESYIHQFDIDQQHQIKGNRGYNIIGFLPGRSNRAIVVTAHYDHLGIKEGEIYNGSDDNASGVASLLHLASQLTDQELEHTLIFTALDAEESNLLGAKAFVRNAPVEIGRVALNINMDMVSRSTKNEIYASGTYHYPQLGSFIEQVRENYMVKLKFGHDRPELGDDDWTDASDHFAFHQANIPFIYFGVEDHDDYHQPTDTFDRTDFEFFIRVSKMIVDFVIAIDKENLSTFRKNDG